MGIVGIAQENRDRLMKVLQGGCTHQVLNARKHDEEAKIIARPALLAL
jgi:preprotein translocase subunit SecA